jgi:hypothetical protein
VPEYLVFEQDTCISSVTAATEQKAWELAKQRLHLTDETPAYLQEVPTEPESNHKREKA